jgi:hypothetical protein
METALEREWVADADAEARRQKPETRLWSSVRYLRTAIHVHTLVLCCCLRILQVAIIAINLSQRSFPVRPSHTLSQLPNMDLQPSHHLRECCFA